MQKLTEHRHVWTTLAVIRRYKKPATQNVTKYYNKAKALVNTDEI